MKKLEPKFDYQIKEFSSQEKDILALFVSFFKVIKMEDKIQYMMNTIKGNYFTSVKIIIFINIC